MAETADTFDLDAVVQRQQQHRERHAQGGVDVGGRYDPHVFEAHGVGKGREPVDRDQVERVHEDDPHENGQRQRGDERAVTVHDRLGLLVDHLDQHFDGTLQAARHTGGRFAGGFPQHQQCQHTGHPSPEHGVQVDHREIDLRLLMSALQVMQVVTDVLSSRLAFFGRLLAHFWAHDLPVRARINGMIHSP